MRVHPNGVTGIASLRVAVADVAASAARYAALAGSDRVTRANGSARVTIGEAALELASDAAARAHVEQRGAGPMSLVLRGSVAKTLDPKLAHGAALSIAP
jgi:hypothetical protein